MDKQKTRDEVNSEDRWKIELIYKDENAFFKDFQQVQKELEKLIEQKEILKVLHAFLSKMRKSLGF